MSSPTSSDEGEIRDVVGSVEKATTTLPQFDGTSVDRQDRNRSSNSTSMSPERGYIARNINSYERSRSPYSDRPRGSKRSRDSDHDDYDDHNRDTRRFKVHYEDPKDHRHRSRISYEDIDHSVTSNSELRYDDRDRYVDKRHRTRSRSPYRSNRSERNGHSGSLRRDGNRHSVYQDIKKKPYEQDDRSRSGMDQSVSKRGESPMPAENARQEAKTKQGSSQYIDKSGNAFALEKPSNAQELDAKIAQPEPEPEVDEATLIEQRRKRREAIKAKYKGAATPLLVQALHLRDKSGQSTPGHGPIGEDGGRSGRSSPVSTPSTPIEIQDPASPSVFAITSDQDLTNTNGKSTGIDEEDGPSAADYDPTMDKREDEQRDIRKYGEQVPSASYDETELTGEQDVLLPTELLPQVQKAKQSSDEFDMFAEDDDDMFAEGPILNGKPSTIANEVAKAVEIPQVKELDIGMLDNWDDAEGYYKIILGELLNGRYHVQSNLGKGMFSGVVRAMDVTTKRLVAIKLIRNNETMRKAGMKEIEILQKLNNADPPDKKHMIRLERHFEHKGHLCMVFENLSINLREVLKKFGRDVGINLKAVQAYAQQMFIGLNLLRKCNILHADLKPDNILVNEHRNMLKICDLGSASDAFDNEIAPYLVSRFYRAPEIILGMPYDFAIDVWSVGCTLYELYTGKILFTGRNNNQMLRSIMDCRGKFTTKMLKRATFAHVHFDDMANFKSVEQDKITGKETIKTLAFVKPSRDLRTRLLSASKHLTDVEMKELNLFADLLDRCLALNPEKRCTPVEALNHPFFKMAVR